MPIKESAVSLTLKEYSQRIVESTLLDLEEVQDFVDRLPDRYAADAIDQLAMSLKEAGKLTSFQDSRIRGGHLNGLALGKYLVLDEIGQGANGMVFRARHREKLRIVALKMIPPAMLQNENAGKRFHREVEAMSRVSHPNIVAAYDAGEDKGAFFLVLEFVNGRDLSLPIRNGKPISVEAAVEYTLQAARGLAHAHSMGIVHRDIKPANMLLSKEGVVKILDMGLARVEDPNEANLTQTGSIMGTVDYMPPEQTMDSKAADHRADIYSLGCTLFHLATGRPVYESDSMVGKIIAHREEPIPSLVEVRPDAPARLDEIFQKMVAKDPEDRYQSMQEVVDELEQLQKPPEESKQSPEVARGRSKPASETHAEPVEAASRIKQFFDSNFGFMVTMLVTIAGMLGFLTWWMFGRN